MSNSKKIYNELKLISNYLGLITAKYTAFFLLVLSYYPMRPVPAYIIATMLLGPLLIQYALYSNSKYDLSENFTMLPTAHKYNFTLKKYKSEKTIYPIIVFLIASWQLSVNRYNVYDFPVRIFPAAILLIYVMARPAGRLFFRLKLHHDFMHMSNI